MNCPAVAVWGSIAALLILICLGCARFQEAEQDPVLTFSAVDVGQGLSQLVVIRGVAVVLDMGPANSYYRWERAYNSLGSPVIAAVCLSHDHEDHTGGLGLLSRTIPFSGQVILSSREDTSAIRTRCGAWSDHVRFRTVSAGDTLGILPGVRIECIWPVAGDIENERMPGDFENRFSMCYKIDYAMTSLLITSDIDTIAEACLSSGRGTSLHSDIMVVPHHGGAGSVDPVFLSYADPQCGIISCALNNPYGHPSNRCIALLFQMYIKTLTTYERGDVVAASNGEYWEFR